MSELNEITDTVNYMIKNMLALLLSFGLIVPASGVWADEGDGKEIWSCKNLYENSNILWLVQWNDKSYIKVFDERIPAEYIMNGLEKTWNFGLESNAYFNYKITLGPDGTARYYDFNNSKDGIAQPRTSYRCKKT